MSIGMTKPPRMNAKARVRPLWWAIRRAPPAALSLGLVLTAAATPLDAATAGATYAVLDAEAPPVPLPARKRVPFQWPAFGVDAEPVVLRPRAEDAQAAAGAPAWLRVTVAIDDAQQRFVDVALAGTGAPLGRLDLRFAHAIETFQLAIPADAVAAVRRHGVTLRRAGEGPPLWFFGSAARGAEALPGISLPYQPHLMSAPAEVDRVAEFHRRLASVASVQTFGWMEGCVLEALRALADRTPAGPYQAALDAHWRLFLPTRDRLVYEDPHSEPADGRVYGIEGGLPFAELARRDPTNPALDLFVNFARSRVRADGSIRDFSLTAEGSYTIAYPLATLAAIRRRPELAELARNQLRLRSEKLWHDGAIWLRAYDDGRRTYRGWSRGVAWHLLGVVRSIGPLREFGDTAALGEELRRAAAWLLPLQRPDGLWSCYVEDRATAPDSSGSAGIAAALARGAQLGVLPPAAGAAARRTLTACLERLTPDGLLDGVAQSNRGGEELQRSDYRVLSQMGMGLLGQLIAECAALPAAAPSQPRRDSK